MWCVVWYLVDFEKKYFEQLWCSFGFSDWARLREVAAFSDCHDRVLAEISRLDFVPLLAENIHLVE